MTARMTMYADAVRDALVARLAAIEGGPLDGTKVLSELDIGLAFAEVPFPPADESTAELVTPATVYLDARCHICGEVARVVVGLESKTTVDDKTRKVAAKVDAGSVDHICGQLPLPVDAGEGWALPVTASDDDDLLP